ncbi:MAG TPA: hypothetical protein VFB38_02225 [Chthonomonadaceae bacterium]|nr:hypothetical protein [Chthonomonadaceae bacterium]
MTQAPPHSPAPSSPPPAPFLKERAWAWGIAALTMLITMVPYLIGASMAEGRVFMWLGYNLDDSCVYLSWMRQAANGSCRALNLFTTAPQHGMALNPLFLALGRIAGGTGLPLLAVYHGARMLFGLALLALVWELILQTISDARARRLAFLFVCFSSGLGWLPLWWETPPLPTPVDKWQPEAITFLSLYLSPLFAFSMALQVGMVVLLLQGERMGQARYAVAAGLCGFFLGLVHTYDIIPMTAIWFAYLLAQTGIFLWRQAAPSISPGTLPSHSSGSASWGHLRDSWLRGLLAGVILAPAVLYIAYQLHTEAVFRARANVPTLSPALYWVLLGYGLTLILALAGIDALYQSEKASSSDPVHARWTTDGKAACLLIVWAIVNIAVSYLPHTAFQRKMLQGAHFPIALLAGIGAAWLLRRWRPSLTEPGFALAATLLTALLCITNVRFLMREVNNFAINRSQTMIQRPYLQPGEIAALEWVAAHTPADAAIQPLFWVASADHHLYVPDTSLACFTPGLIGRKVYCGHWGETPEFGKKLAELARFGLPRTTDAERLALLRKMKVRYLVFSQKAPSDTAADILMPMFRGLAPLPPYLTHVYPDPNRGEINAEADVYEVSSYAAGLSPGVTPLEARTSKKASTTRGSNWRPLSRLISSRACGIGQGSL